MTKAELEDAFHDADRIEYTESGEAFVHFNSGAYPLIFRVENESGVI